jgi:hypothetical protein
MQEKRRDADPIAVAAHNSMRSGRQACREIRGGPEDVNGVNPAFVLPFQRYSMRQDAPFPNKPNWTFS